MVQGIVNRQTCRHQRWPRWRVSDGHHHNDGSYLGRKKKGKRKISFLSRLRRTESHRSPYMPWLWECVSALLQQQLWDQCVQNLRTGPLSIPEAHESEGFRIQTDSASTLPVIVVKYVCFYFFYWRGTKKNSLCLIWSMSNYKLSVNWARSGLNLRKQRHELHHRRLHIPFLCFWW